MYVATDGGLGIITYEPYTLQQKSDFYERWIEEWGMRRMGFVSSLLWDAKRNEWIRFISDNDGGWAAICSTVQFQKRRHQGSRGAGASR